MALPMAPLHVEKIRLRIPTRPKKITGVAVRSGRVRSRFGNGAARRLCSAVGADGMFITSSFTTKVGDGLSEFLIKGYVVLKLNLFDSDMSAQYLFKLKLKLKFWRTFYCLGFTQITC